MQLGDEMWYEDLADELLNVRPIESYQVMALCAREFAQGKALVLFELYRSDESYTPSQLSSTLGLSSGRIANILKSLQASGYVLREKDTEDARRVHVVLTQEGKEQACEVHAGQVRACEKILQALGQEDAEALMRIIRKIPTLSL